jgi:hypothetical protein
MQGEFHFIEHVLLLSTIKNIFEIKYKFFYTRSWLPQNITAMQSLD